MAGRTIGSLIVYGGLFAWIPSSAQTQTKPHVESARLIESIQGPALYGAYCAVCHGKDGKGSGPMAKALKTMPPDLTRIALRDGGRFPLAQDEKIISGEQPLPAGHGTREMQVWGPVFSQWPGIRIWGASACITWRGTSRPCKFGEARATGRERR